ncbi:hypothetical protein [Alkalicoccobacillus gibsonii]
MISKEKLKLIKKLSGVSIFLKADIEERKKEQDILRKKYRP